MKIIKYTLVKNMLHNSKSNENHVLNENVKFNWPRLSTLVSTFRLILNTENCIKLLLFGWRLSRFWYHIIAHRWLL